ncbi:MAG TPA: hypothetical protein VHA75_18305 [Rugosimonospora sp.]|nr:hypothetical protein [Rugosimonospora sp.]
MPSDKIDLDAIRARHEDHMVLWAGPVEAMTMPFTAAGAVTCAAAAASAADVPALLAEVDRLRDLVEQVTREKFREKTELRASHAEVLERLHADYNEQINALIKRGATAR